jgi:hypothetical protein
LRLTLLEGLARLPVKDRTVLVLRYWEDLSSTDEAFHPVALRRDPAGWTATKQPVDLGRLDDVVVRAADDVCAVGTDETDSQQTGPLMQHWDGSRWTVVPAPQLPAEVAGGLTAVAVAGTGTSRDQGTLWVAGYQHSDTATDPQTVFRHVDGEWQSVSNKGLEDIRYTWEVVPAADDDVWLAGIGGIAHYDGREWTMAKLPGAVPDGRVINIQDLNVVAPDDIWAVGHRPDDELWRHPLVLHYDGTHWTEIPAPDETAQLFALEFLNGQTIALGARGDNLVDPYVLTLEGGQFVRSEDPPGAGILSGTVREQGRLWTVGSAVRNGAGFDPYIAVAE